MSAGTTRNRLSDEAHAHFVKVSDKGAPKPRNNQWINLKNRNYALLTAGL